ncbi:MAG: PIN domain-containing protein [Victivallales bacterium]|nr:PIN domain-containing protein [Victivallales bacterium]
MPGKIFFLDSNILVYVYSEDEPVKRDIARSLCRDGTIVSLQVLNEMANVLTRKFKLSPHEVLQKIEEISSYADVKGSDIACVRKALQIMGRFQYSYFDCLILATAIENNCPILYSEDLQHGQVIDGMLQIVNPFLDL